MVRLYVTALCLTAATSAGVATAPATAATAYCHGRPATIEASSGIVTGTAGDDVIVVTGAVDQVNAGPGADLICVVSANVHWLNAGDGDDTVDTTQNAGFSTVTRLEGGTNTFLGGAGQDHVDLGYGPTAPSTDTVATGGGDDTVTLAGHIAHLDVATGKGDDTLRMSNRIPASGPVDLGPGDNALDVELLPLNGGPSRIRVNLPRHRIAVLGGRLTVAGKISDVFASAHSITIVGNTRDNTLTANGCRVTLRGGSGQDQLTLQSNKATSLHPCPNTPVSRQYGDAGNDTMTGLSGPDFLIGGPGQDRAFGLRGIDTCEAELQRKCEL